MTELAAQIGSDELAEAIDLYGPSIASAYPGMLVPLFRFAQSLIERLDAPNLNLMDLCALVKWILNSRRSKRCEFVGPISNPYLGYVTVKVRA